MRLAVRTIWLAVLAGGVLSPLVAAPPAEALEQKLVASDGDEDDYFGHSVAVDSDTAVVGADQNRTLGLVPGAAYVFTRTGDTWTQSARLTASDGEAGDGFGGSVAIDGDTIVVGAPFDDIGTDDEAGGSVYTFTRAGAANRTETAKLNINSPGAEGGQLGASVAIYGDVIAAGALADTTGSTLSHGAVYTFDRTGAAERTERSRLLASDRATGDLLGSSVAMDGDVIVAGAPNKSTTAGAGFHKGAAYTFDSTKTGTDDEIDKLIPTDGLALDQLGNSVAIDGDAIVVAAYRDTVTAGNNYQGSAYTFERTGGDQTGKLLASDGAGEDGFGFSTGISGDTIVAGSYLDDVGTNPVRVNEGSVYTFARTSPDAERNELTKLLSSTGASSDYLGFSLAIDGDVIVAGAEGDDVGGETAQGSASIFFAPATTPACSDGGDNDGDGLSDYPEDPGCTSVDDTSEADTFVPQPPGGAGSLPPPRIAGSRAPPRIVGGSSAGSAKVSKNGSFTLKKTKVVCNPAPNGDCGGRTAIITIIDNARAARKKTVKLGGSRFRVASGKSARIKGKLTRKGLRLLKKRKRLKAKVKITVTRARLPKATKTVAVTLKAPR